jgi:hypothetical protein
MGAAAIPVLVTAAATAYSAYSNVQAGKAQKKAADKAEDRSERAAGLLAVDTEKEHRRIIASQEALYGAAGLTMEGSPLLVQQEALTQSKEQLDRILEGGGFSADVYRQAGQEATMAGNAGAIQSLLSGAGDVYTSGADYKWW